MSVNLFPGLDDLLGIAPSAALPDAVVDRRMRSMLDLMYGRGAQTALEQSQAASARALSPLGAVDRGVDAGVRFAGKTLGDVGHLSGGAWGAIEGLSHAPGSYDPLGEIGRGAEAGYEGMRSPGSTVADAAVGLGMPERSRLVAQILGDLATPGIGPGEAAALGKLAPMLGGAIPLSRFFLKGDVVKPEVLAEVNALAGGPVHNSTVLDLALARLRHGAGEAPVTGSRQEIADELTRAMTTDMRAAEAGIGVTPRDAKFYPRSREAFHEVMPRIGANMESLNPDPEWQRVGALLRGEGVPALAATHGAGLSPSNTPLQETNQNLMGLLEHLRLRARGIDPVSAAVNTKRGAPRGGYAIQPPWSPTGPGKNLHVYGRGNHPVHGRIASLAMDPYQRGLSVEEQLAEQGEYLSKLQRIEDVLTRRGGWPDETALQRELSALGIFDPKAVPPSWIADRFIPQQLEGGGQLWVPGTAIIGNSPKTAAYAHSNLQGWSHLGANDEQASRLQRIVLGGLVTRNGEEASLAQIDRALEWVRKNYDDKAFGSKLQKKLDELGLVIDSSPQPRNFDERWIYQDALERSAREMGWVDAPSDLPMASKPMEIGWGQVKNLRGGLGVGTPREGDVLTKMQQLEARSARTGFPFPTGAEHAAEQKAAAKAKAAAKKTVSMASPASSIEPPTAHFAAFTPQAFSKGKSDMVVLHKSTTGPGYRVSFFTKGRGLHGHSEFATPEEALAKITGAKYRPVEAGVAEAGLARSAPPSPANAKLQLDAIKRAALVDADEKLFKAAVEKLLTTKGR